jgi:hypothetical protein
MNRLYVLILLFLLVVSYSLSLSFSAHAAISAAGSDFLFFYSNDVQGETEPCG